MNKNNATSQIVKHQRRDDILHSIVSKDTSKPKSRSKPQSQESESEALPFMSPKDHHHIRESQRSYDDILAWVYERKDNPGMKVRLYHNLKA